MRMHILSGGRIRMKKSTYIPDADRHEMIELPVSCALLRHPQGNVLFDTGCHPSIAEDPEPRWGALTKFMLPMMTRDDNVISDLSAVGLIPDDIDVVVCSHLHTDHCGCNAFFSKATVIIHALELEAAKAADAVRNGYLRVDWDHPMPTTDLEADRCHGGWEDRPYTAAGTHARHNRCPDRTGSKRKVPARFRCTQYPRKPRSRDNSPQYVERRALCALL